MKRKHGLSPMERIERKRTITEAGCWETPFIPSKPYPSLKIEGRHVLVHRIAYETLVGPIPSGLFVCHRCDNPRCHNPEHLFLGDAFANMQDMASKGRAGKGLPRRHDHEAVQALSHLSQVEIAAELKISQGSVSRILRQAGLARGRTTLFGKAKRGEAHGRALVTEADVRAIRDDPRTAKEIAEDYPLGHQAIQAIKSRRTWKHVD